MKIILYLIFFFLLTNITCQIYNPQNKRINYYKKSDQKRNSSNNKNQIKIKHYSKEKKNIIKKNKVNSGKSVKIQYLNKKKYSLENKQQINLNTEPHNTVTQQSIKNYTINNKIIPIKKLVPKKEKKQTSCWTEREKKDFKIYLKEYLEYLDSDLELINENDEKFQILLKSIKNDQEELIQKPNYFFSYYKIKYFVNRKKVSLYIKKYKKQIKECLKKIFPLLNLDNFMVENATIFKYPILFQILSELIISSQIFNSICFNDEYYELWSKLEDSVDIVSKNSEKIIFILLDIFEILENDIEYFNIHIKSFIINSIKTNHIRALKYDHNIEECFKKLKEKLNINDQKLSKKLFKKINMIYSIAYLDFLVSKYYYQFYQNNKASIIKKIVNQKQECSKDFEKDLEKTFEKNKKTFENVSIIKNKTHAIFLNKNQ